MAIEDPKDNTEEDPMAAWAEALEEQKTAAAPDPEQGGPLSGAEAAPRQAFNTDGTMQDINMVLDIPVTLSVELGRVTVPIKYILQLAQGSVVELDALAGEPMDVLV